jgi:hypothetical protein
MRLDTLVSNDPPRALVYGPTGSGKSTLAGLMALHAQFTPIYVADWDLRIASLRRKLPANVWQNIEVEPYRDVNIQGEAFTKLQAKLERLQSEGFKAFVNDSLTFCTRAVMARVLMLDGNKPPTFTPQLQHYMQQISLVEEFVSRACSKNMAVIMTCHEDTQRDEILGRLYKAVDLTGKSANRIPGYFNEFWHCEVLQTSAKEPQYCVRTRSDMVYAARTSFKTLDPVEAADGIWGKIIAEMNPSPTAKP